MLLALLTTPLYSDQLISETFTTSPAFNFVTYGGTWDAVGSKYVLSSPETGGTTGINNISIHNTVLTGDWTLTVSARTVGTSSPWNDFSVIFGYQNAYNYYVFNSNESNDEESSGVAKVVGGNITELADINVMIKPDKSYVVKIVKTGSTYKIYRDNAILATVTDSTWTTGKVGLGTLNDGASFDNLMVWSGPYGPVAKPNSSNTGPRYSLTTTLTPAQALAQARSTGLVERARITGALTLNSSDANWVMRDCKIEGNSMTYAISAVNATATGNNRPVFEYCEIASNGATTGNISSAVFYGSSVILKHCELYGAQDIIKPVNNVVVYASYLHGHWKGVDDKGNSSHCDVMQIAGGGGQNVEILWNTMHGTVEYGIEIGSMASGITEFGKFNAGAALTNIHIFDNWVDYATHYQLRGSTFSATPTSDLTFRRNKHGPHFGSAPFNAMGGSGISYDSSNVWECNPTIPTTLPLPCPP